MDAITTWVMGGLAAALGFFGARLWAHVVECGSERRHTDSKIAGLEARQVSLESDMERAKQDIGTHDSGMRGNIHALANECAKYELRISALERERR